MMPSDKQVCHAIQEIIAFFIAAGLLVIGAVGFYGIVSAAQCIKNWWRKP